MKQHSGIHVCILSQGVPSQVKATIHSCRKSNLDIRSICIACLETEPYMECLQGEDCQMIPLDFCPKTSRKQAMNTIVEYYKKKVILWLVEGEILAISQPVRVTDESGILVRIQKDRCFTWEMRFLSLRFPWYFEDISGKFPVLYHSQAYRRRIGKISNTLILQEQKIEKQDYAKEHHESHGIYNQARQALLDGEMEIATHRFKQVVKTHQDTALKDQKDAVVRSYLGVAIAHQLANLEWNRVKVYLESGFRVSQHRSLEILYFWIRFARARKKSAEVVLFVLDKYVDVIYEIQPPENSTFSYEIDIYHYRCLVEWMIICFENNYFRQAMEAAQELKNRKYIPLEYRETIEFMFEEAKNHYETYQTYDSIRESKSLVKSDNVAISIGRMGELYVYSSQITDRHLECAIGNKNFVAQGIRWLNQHIPDNTDTTYWKFQAIYEKPLVCKGFVMCGKERACFPLPWMMWEGNKTITDIEEKKYQNPISNYNENNIVDLTLENAFEKLCSSLEYDRICLIGRGRWTDIMCIAYALLHGCLVFYQGSRAIAEVFYPNFREEVYYLGNITKSDLLSLMNSYTIEWSSRNTTKKASQLSCSAMAISQFRESAELDSIAIVEKGLQEKPLNTNHSLQTNCYRYQKPVVYSCNSYLDKATRSYLYWIITQINGLNHPVDAVCIKLPVYTISLSYVRYQFKSTLSWREHFTPTDIWEKNQADHVTVFYQKALAKEWLKQDVEKVSLVKNSKYYRILYIE